MPNIPSQNTNLFRQTPVRGQRDLGIVSGSGAIAMQISTNQATELYAGSRVKLDATITAPMPFPQVVAALDNEAAFAIIGYTAKQSSFSAGDVIEAFAHVGPITYQVAAAIIAAGAKVEMASGFVQTKASGSTFGIALDPAVLNGFVRIATLMPLQA